MRQKVGAIYPIATSLLVIGSYAVRTLQALQTRERVINVSKRLAALRDCPQPSGSVVGISYHRSICCRHRRALVGLVVSVADQTLRSLFRKQAIGVVISEINRPALRIVDMS